MLITFGALYQIVALVVMRANHTIAAGTYGMKRLAAIALAAIALSACNFKSYSANPGARERPAANAPGGLTYEEKHRLYTAALMAADSPLDSEVFKQACKRIGIMDANDNLNGNYMEFVREHVDWGLKVETEQFRREINTKAKAEEYANNCLLSK